MKFKLKKLINKNIVRIRYILSGFFFTVLGPSFFILLATYISPKIAIVIADVCIHILRFNVITRWVFRLRINKKSIYSYFKATIPISISNFILVSLLVPLLGNFVVALLIAAFSATIGFAWNKISYERKKIN